MTQRFVCKFATFLAITLSFDRRAAPRIAAQERDVIPLETGACLERRLNRGEEHRYTIALSAGEHATVVVTQRGVDVVVRVQRPDGSAIADFDDEVGARGEESVDVVAGTDGEYAVAISPAPGTTAPGLYEIRLADRRPATDVDRSIQESRELRTIAARLDEEGRFADARPLLERALTLAETSRGSYDPQVAAVAARLAGVYLKLPDNLRSESLYQRALAIMDRTPGSEHPATAFVRSRLAVLYQHAGQGARAEALVRQAMDVIERTLGPEHPLYVNCLMTLANIKDDAGDLDEEERIDRRALAITEKNQETNSTTYAGLLNNLGELYRQKEDYPHARDFLGRALALGETLRGTGSYYITTTLQNLGVVAREQKDYPTAEAYYTRALTIREKVLGSSHPEIAQLLNNMAALYRAKGDEVRSLQTHFRALRIWEEAFGEYQRGTLVSVGNIARTYAGIGDVANALAFERRVDDIVERQLVLNLAVGSERQKLAFVKSTAERTDRTISLHLRQAPGDSGAGELAALVLLQRKGRVLDAMTDAFAAVRQRVADEGDQKLLDQLKSTIAQLARIASSPPDQQPAAERRNRIKELEGAKERLEAELSENSAEFRAQMQPVTLEAVQDAIPDDAALLEFAIFRPFDAKAERNAEAYGPSHYAAYVIRNNAAPVGRDLGPAAAIDDAVDAFRQTLRDRTRVDLKQRAREVDRLVMEPIGAFLGGATRLLISPDGDLNLVPFEALVDDRGAYLIEGYAMSYLTSGRDLLRMQVVRENRSEPIIVADPLFGEPGTASRTAAAGRSPRGTTTGDDPSHVYFPPLAASAGEARAIKALFPDATLLTGRRATKATLQHVEAPLMLHIASHGFFLPDGNDVSRHPAAAAGSLNWNLGVDSPLLRSGLALAGANLAHGSRDEGILTALEAMGLNLWGTRLVTLSGCDTGVGEVRNGEGVYGLRRAFVLAGTQTLVMSLWQVTDSIARETMVAYYTGLRAGLGRGDALRQAKLDMLKRAGRQHPFYWASFIQSGEWASLDGTR